MIALMLLEIIKKKNWQKNWAGPWSLLSCAYLGYQYTQQLKEVIGVSLEEALFVTKEGITSCYFLDEHKEAFGKALCAQAEVDPTLVTSWAQNLKKVTDEVLQVVADLKKEPLTEKNFQMFLEALYAYGVAHRIVKVVVDYLPKHVLDESLEMLSEARVYAEPAYEKTEEYMQYMAGQVSEVTGVRMEFILAMKRMQWERYLMDGFMSDVNELERQYYSTVLYMQNGSLEYIDSLEDQVLLEKSLLKEENVSELKGQTAYKGKVVGRVRVILDPKKVNDFSEGDILVTGMTRPEYLSLVKKSVAFVTDAGGVLSHAAITARELQKPCVIGTNQATKVLKDGDLVEVDADNGVVRILERV